MSKVTLDVQRNNPAKGQYQKIGFIFDETRLIFRSSKMGSIDRDRYNQRCSANGLPTISQAEAT